MLLAATMPPGEVPCDLCGTYTLPELLERTPEYCARERWCCEACFEQLEAEEREEAAIAEQNARHVDSDWALGLR